MSRGGAISQNPSGRLVAATALASAIAVMLVLGAESNGAAVVAGSPATGMIVAVRGDWLVDGETFTLDDGATQMTFEFDFNGSGSPGNFAVELFPGVTADGVANEIRRAVNSSILAVTASSDGSAAVQLVNDNVGPEGNVPMTESVAALEFTVSGMSGGTDPNRPPVAVEDTATAVNGFPVSINVLANDSDPESDTLAVTAVTQGTNGSVTNNSNGTVTYDPVCFQGTDTFTYTIDDGYSGSDVGQVTVTVRKTSRRGSIPCH